MQQDRGSPLRSPPFPTWTDIPLTCHPFYWWAIPEPAYLEIEWLRPEGILKNMVEEMKLGVSIVAVFRSAKG